MSQKIFPLLITTILLFFLSGINASAQDTYRDLSTSIEFPNRLGSLTFRGKHNYSNPALGTSLRYTLGNDVKADIYIYNLNIKNIGNNKITKPVIDQLVKAVQDVYTVQKKGLYNNVKPYPNEEKLKFNYKKIKDIQFTWTALTYNQTGNEETNRSPRRSFIYLTSKKDQFIKIRYTYMQSHGNIGHQIFTSFMKALAREL